MKGLLFVILTSTFFGYAQPASTFNGLKPQTDSSGNYSFWVSGHFYGEGTNKSGYPVNTLLGNLNMINSSDKIMLMSLGDLFKDVRNDIPFYEKALFSQLRIPLYNAVGNHDLSGDVYQENFGATFFYFLIENDVHVILDTELDNGDIEDEQLGMLKEVADLCKSSEIKNVLIYAHRTIWKNTYDDLENILNDNTQSMTGNNFESDVLPLLKTISKSAQVYMFGGSLGDAPFSFLHFQGEENITYIATAIRGIKRDAMLIVNSDQGKISFETVSLTGQELEELSYYTVEQWETTSPHEPFNWRLLPLYIKQIVLSWGFLFGSVTTLILVFIIRFIIKRRRRTKPLS